MRSMSLVFGMCLAAQPIAAVAQVALSNDALRQCAQAGVTECQFRYGQKLQHGRGVSRNLTEAKRLYEAAYAAGFQPAGQALLDLLRTDQHSGTAVPTPSATINTASAPSAGPATSTAVDNAATASPPTAPCADSAEMSHSCTLSASGTAIELQGKRLTILLEMQNPTAARAYVSRGLLRAYQSTRSLTVLDASQSTDWGRTAQRGTSALGFLVGMIPGKPGLSAGTAARNLGTTAARKGVDAIRTPSGLADYLSIGYIEPASDMNAVVMVEILDLTAPVDIEMEIGSEKVRFSVSLPRT